MSGRKSVADPGGAPNHLKAWRESAGYSQVSVERIYGWPGARLSHLENGAAIVTEEILHQLSRLYVCEPGDLLRSPPASRRLRSRGASRGPALLVALTELRHLIADVRSMRTEFEPRIEGLEAQLTQVSVTIAEAIKNADEMTDLFERSLTTIRHAIQTPPRRRRRAATAAADHPGEDDAAG